MRIVDAGYQDLCRSRANARDGLDAFDARIILADRLELFDHDIELSSKGIELCQFDIKLSLPEFVGLALYEWFSEGVDELAARMPSLFAGIDGDAVVDEPSPNGALHLGNAMIECLAVLHQGSEFSVHFGWHVDRFQFVHRRHSGELESVVFVGLSFDVGPFPSVFIGGANKCLQAVAHGQVVDPARGSAGFHDH